MEANVFCELSIGCTRKNVLFATPDSALELTEEAVMYSKRGKTGARFDPAVHLRLESKAI